MGLSVRTGAGGHLVDLGEGNFEPETTRILFVFFGSTNERLCRRACKNRDISYFKSHNTPIIYIYLQVRSTSSIPPSAPTSTKWHRIVPSIHLCTIKYKFAFEICQPLFPNKIAKKFVPLKKLFSVTSIIYLSERRHYGTRHIRRRDTRMGQEPPSSLTWNAWTAAWSCSGKTAPPERRWNRATGKPSAPPSTRTTSRYSGHPRTPHSLHEIRGASPYRRGCRQRHRELSQSSWGV